MALVAQDHGAAISLAVAKRLLVVAKHQGGQSQFSPYLTASAEDDSPVAKIQRHAMEHIGEPFSVERLAEVVLMRSRSFARIFAREAKITPARIRAARANRCRPASAGRQRQSDQAVAYHCGFGSAARMRLIFSQQLGVTPTRYRESFRKSSYKL